MRLASCADCYCRLLGYQGPPVAYTGGSRAYRRAYWQGREHWLFEGFRLSASVDALESPGLSLACDVCSTTDQGFRFAIEATDMLDRQKKGTES